MLGVLLILGEIGRVVEGGDAVGAEQVEECDATDSQRLPGATR